MKKFSILLVLFLCAVSYASAQDFEKLRFGVTAGANFSSTTSEYADMKVGYFVGVKGEYNFSNSLYANAVLKFDMKGAKVDDENINAGYISLPIHVGYRYSLSESINLFGEVGPYFAYGIAGETEGVKTFDYWEKFDLGIGAKVGAEFSGLQVSVGYDYGLLDLGGGAKNVSLKAGVAYMF